MKTLRVYCGIALAMIGFTCQAQEEILLRRTFEPDVSETYKATLTSRTIIKGTSVEDQEKPILANSMKLLTKFGKIDKSKGVIDIDMLFTDFKEEKQASKESPLGIVTFVGEQPPLPKEIKGKGTLSALNILREFYFLVDSPQQMARFNQISSVLSLIYDVSFPEKPVKSGDSWEVTLHKALQKPKYTAKYVGEKKIDGISVYEISLDRSQISTNPTFSYTVDQGPSRSKSTAKTSEHVRLIYNKLTGKLISATSESSVTSNMEGGDTGTFSFVYKTNLEIKVDKSS